MTCRPLLLAGLMLLAGCAHRGDPVLPACEGSDRRPANPHGSVLAPEAPPQPAAPAAGAAVNPGAGGCA